MFTENHLGRLSVVLATMKMQTIFVLCCASLIGCNGPVDVPSNLDSKDMRQGDGDLQSALSRISIGTLNSDLTAIMKPIRWILEPFIGAAPVAGEYILKLLTTNRSGLNCLDQRAVTTLLKSVQ